MILSSFSPPSLLPSICYSFISSVTIHRSPLSSSNALPPAKESPPLLAFFSAPLSHYILSSSSFILSKVTVFDLPWHIRIYCCWVRATLSRNVNKRGEKKQVCIVPDDGAVFVIIQFV